MPLTHSVILITGAASGLGRSAALALAKQGAHIILLDRDLAKLEQTYDAIVAAHGPEPILYPFDLAGANEDQYQELADKILEKYGSLQGLLHSAADFSAFTPIAQTSTKIWLQSMHVNLNAAFLLTRVLLPVLQNSSHASVVFTSDSAVKTPKAYASAYGVAKIALAGLAGILAEELEAAGKVRVNMLVPGPVDSPIRKKAYPGEDKTKLPKPDDLASVYQYLFGAASIGVTGQTIEARTFHL